MTRSVKDQNVQQLIDIAHTNGWDVEFTRNGNHLRFKPANPDKPIIIGTHKRGDPRSFKNLRSDLRRAGLPV